jgi:hypothetical protein
MTRGKHAVESANKATVKKAAIATAVAAATMLTGANAALAAPAAGNKNCTPNAEDQKTLASKQNNVADARAAAMKAATAADKAVAARKAAEAKSEDLQNKITEAKKAKQTADKNLKMLNDVKDALAQAEAKVQPAKDAFDAASKTADEKSAALDQANKAVNQAVSDKADAEQALKTAQAEDKTAQANKKAAKAALDEANKAVAAYRLKLAAAEKKAEEANKALDAANDAVNKALDAKEEADKRVQEATDAWVKAHNAANKLFDKSNNAATVAKLANAVFNKKSAEVDELNEKVANDSPLNKAQGDTFEAYLKAKGAYGFAHNAYLKASAKADKALQEKNAAWDTFKAKEAEFDELDKKVANDSPLNKAQGDNYEAYLKAKGAYGFAHNAFLKAQAAANKALDEKNAAWDAFQDKKAEADKLSEKVGNHSPLNKAQGDAYEKLTKAKAFYKLAQGAFAKASKQHEADLTNKNNAYSARSKADAAVAAYALQLQQAQSVEQSDSAKLQQLHTKLYTQGPSSTYGYDGHAWTKNEAWVKVIKANADATPFVNEAKAAQAKANITSFAQAQQLETAFYNAYNAGTAQSDSRFGYNPATGRYERFEAIEKFIDMYNAAVPYIQAINDAKTAAGVSTVAQAQALSQQFLNDYNDYQQLAPKVRDENNKVSDLTNKLQAAKVAAKAAQNAFQKASDKEEASNKLIDNDSPLNQAQADTYAGLSTAKAADKLAGDNLTKANTKHDADLSTKNAKKTALDEASSSATAAQDRVNKLNTKHASLKRDLLDKKEALKAADKKFQDLYDDAQTRAQKAELAEQNTAEPRANVMRRQVALDKANNGLKVANESLRNAQKRVANIQAAKAGYDRYSDALKKQSEAQNKLDGLTTQLKNAENDPNYKLFVQEFGEGYDAIQNYNDALDAAHTNLLKAHKNFDDAKAALTSASDAFKAAERKFQLANREAQKLEREAKQAQQDLDDATPEHAAAVADAMKASVALDKAVAAHKAIEAEIAKFQVREDCVVIPAKDSKSDSKGGKVVVKAGDKNEKKAGLAETGADSVAAVAAAVVLLSAGTGLALSRKHE